MAWFKKDKKEEIVDIEKINEKGKIKKEAVDYDYRVYLKDIHGSNTKKVLHFGVKRWIDEDTSTVYLLNDTHKFREPLPEDTNDWKIHKIQEVEDKIKEIEKQLSQELKKDDPKINKKNLEYDLSIYKSYKRSLQLQGRGSYLNYDEDGVPYFVFRRKGNFKLPEFDNVELDTIYTPSEAKIKEASELLDMKKEKYSKFLRNYGNMMIILFVLQLLFLGGLAWYSFKLNKQYDESAVSMLNQRVDDTALYCAKLYGEAGENFYNASVNVKNITETLVTDLHKPQTIIEGVKPN